MINLVMCSSNVWKNSGPNYNKNLNSYLMSILSLIHNYLTIFISLLIKRRVSCHGKLVMDVCCFIRLHWHFFWDVLGRKTNRKMFKKILVCIFRPSLFCRVAAVRNSQDLGAQSQEKWAMFKKSGIVRKIEHEVRKRQDFTIKFDNCKK